jgi:hypothetical protein
MCPNQCHISDFRFVNPKDTLILLQIGIRHPALFKSTAAHLVGSDPTQINGKQERIRGLDDFSPQGLGNTAWAYARQAQLVESVNERIDLAASVLSNMGKMAVCATSFFDIGETLVQRLFGAIAEANLRVHGTFPALHEQ